jgi:hypothetical protein
VTMNFHHQNRPFRRGVIHHTLLARGSSPWA